MQKVKLGDICEKGGSNIAQKDVENNNGNYPIYGAAGLIKYVDFYQQEKEYIAVVKDGAGIGRAMKLPAKSSVIGTMQYIFPKENVSIDYLFYLLSHLNLAKYFSGATIPHMYFKDYKNEEVNLPSIEEQKAIAEKLDKVSSLIEKRKQQLSLLDTLVKSKFVEMFGAKNRSDFDVVPLHKAAKKIFAGGDKPKKLVTIKDDVFKYPVYANGYENEGLQGYSCDYKVDEYAITISARGTIGYCFIRSPYFIPVVRLITIVPNEKSNLVYLKCALQNLDFKASGTSQAQLTVPLIMQEHIVLPPIQLQNQFADFVKQTERAKAKIKQSLAALELLKKSLMEKYFG